MACILLNKFSHAPREGFCQSGDFTANLMAEVCHDVSVEPNLQTVASAIAVDGSKIDIASNIFWGGCFDLAYFLISVSLIHQINSRTSLQTTENVHMSNEF